MNARAAIRGVGVVLGLLLCGGVAQAQDYVDKGQDGNDPTKPWIFHWETQSYMCQFGTTLWYEITPLADPRGFASRPLSAGYAPYIPPGGSACVSDAHIAIGMNGVREPNPDGLSAGWPIGHTTAAESETANGYSLRINGTYRFRMGYDQGGHHELTVHAYLIEGQWSTQPPPPNWVDNVDDTPPGQGSTPGTALRVVVRVAGTLTGGASVTAKGPTKTATLTTSSDGVALFTAAESGNYTITVLHPTSGTPTSKQRYVSGGITTSIEVDFKADGSAEWGNTATSEDGGWLSNILRDLLLPKQETLDNLKGQFSSFINWGPAQLVSELVALKDTPAGSKPVIGVPAISFINANGLPGNPTVTGTIPIDHTPFTSGPVWGWIRGFMGAGVWIGFAVVLAHKLRPKQTF